MADGHEVISFDLSNEVIVSTFLPHINSFMFITIDVFDGSLALINDNGTVGEFNIKRFMFVRVHVQRDFEKVVCK